MPAAQTLSLTYPMLPRSKLMPRGLQPARLRQEGPAEVSLCTARPQLRKPPFNNLKKIILSGLIAIDRQQLDEPNPRQ